MLLKSAIKRVKPALIVYSIFLCFTGLLLILFMFAIKVVLTKEELDQLKDLVAFLKSFCGTLPILGAVGAFCIVMIELSIHELSKDNAN